VRGREGGRGESTGTTGGGKGDGKLSAGWIRMEVPWCFSVTRRGETARDGTGRDAASWFALVWFRDVSCSTRAFFWLRV
jgi:hypothetical protein